MKSHNDPYNNPEITRLLKLAEWKKELFESFCEYIVPALEAQGNYNIKVSNIRIEKDKVIADISYNWRLNAWEKKAQHKDVVSFIKDDKWHSSLVHS